MIVAFEGVDGAGKNTLVSAVAAELNGRGLTVHRLAFPRYDTSVHAQLAQRALYRQMGDLTDSIYGMATLFALDRQGASPEIARRSAAGEVVLLDRFTASNAAYSAARSVLRDGGLQGGAPGGGAGPSGSITRHGVVEWVAQLEFEQLQVPRPDLTVLVDVDAAVAGERAHRRESQDASRARDAYETDTPLQRATAEAYRELAERNWNGPWLRTDSTGPDVTERAGAIAEAIAEAVAARLSP